MDGMNMNQPPAGGQRPGEGGAGAGAGAGTEGGSKTLWIGDVEPWMNEGHIAAQFNQIATVTNVKLIRDKSRAPVGYGFVEFPDWQTARDVFHSLNGKRIPGGSNKCFKLNWASHGGGVARANPSAPSYESPGRGGMMGGQNMPMGRGGYGGGGGQHMGGGFGGAPPHQQPPQPQTEGHQVYVGDLDPAVTNPIFLTTFQQIYPSCFEAKVICDPVTRVSKGYGFIKFGSKEESERALQEMQGKQILGRPIKMNYASQRNRNQGDSAPGGMPGGGMAGGGGMSGGGMNRYNNNMNQGGGMNPGGHMGGNPPGMPHLQGQHSGGQYPGQNHGPGGYQMNQYGGPPPPGSHMMPPGGGVGSIPGGPPGLGGPMGHPPYGMGSQMPPHNPYGQGMGGYGNEHHGMGQQSSMMNSHGAPPGMPLNSYGQPHPGMPAQGAMPGPPSSYHPGQQNGGPPQHGQPSPNGMPSQMDQYGSMGGASRQHPQYGPPPGANDPQRLQKQMSSNSYQQEPFQNGAPNSHSASASLAKPEDLGSHQIQAQSLEKSPVGNPADTSLQQVNQSATYDPLDVNPIAPLEQEVQSPPVSANQTLLKDPNEYPYYQQQPQPIKTKLPIAPLSKEMVEKMNSEYLEPLLDESDHLYII